MVELVPNAAAATPNLGYAEDVAELFAKKRAFAADHVQQLRAFLADTDSPASKCPDEMLARFLESNTHVSKGEVKSVSIKQAAKAIEATVRWRKQQGLDEEAHPLTKGGCPCCDKDPYGHCLFSVGVDKRGWECVYTCAGRTTNKDPRVIERHLVLALESYFRPTPERPSPPVHFCLLFDLHGFGLSDMDPRVAMRVIPILLSHYPDRVAQVAILDAPFGEHAASTPQLHVSFCAITHCAAVSHGVRCVTQSSRWRGR